MADPVGVFSVFALNALPGTPGIFNDGQPIEAGNAFYIPAAAAGNWEIVGARVWIPATAATANVVVHFHADADLAATPTLAATIASGAVVKGAWNEVTFPAPYTLTKDAPLVVAYSVGNEYYVTTSPGTGAIAPSDPASPVSMTPATGPPGSSRTVYRYGTGSAAATAAGWLAGVDMVVRAVGAGSPPGQGTAESTTTWSGTSTGARASRGTASGTTTWAGTATGTAPALGVPSGSATGTTTWTGTSTGARASRGTATGTTTWTGTATGVQSARSIAAENALTGNARATWFDGVGSEAMPAFARSTYYAPGQTVQLSVDYNAGFTVELFRLGHYAGNGARRVDTVTGTPVDQPNPVVIPASNGAVTCAAWSVNATWAVPTNATPGWYYALLKGTNGTDFGHVLFAVTDKLAKKPVLIVTGEGTWHAAYNGYGGNNIYGAAKAIGDSWHRALCSTYDKPVITRDYVPQTHFLNNTYPYLKWSERMGIEAGHTTIEQIKNDPSILDGREVIVWVGHNEYVPQQVMDKTKALLAAGQNMVNIAGNDFFWRTKFTDGAFDSTTDGRVMWCRKDSLSGPDVGPDAGLYGSHVGGVPFTTQAQWTGTWQDTRWTLREPSSAFFGDRFIANGIRSDAVTVPAAMKSSPAWRNCPGVQALTTGQSYAFAAGTLGMEWDKPVPGETALPMAWFSQTTIMLTGQASDINGANYSATDNATHGFVLVRNGSSLIANFNSDQWSWALDALHLRGSAAADVNAQQMMLNVLADLGAPADPGSVAAASLTAPTPVTDPIAAYGIPTGDSASGTASGTTTWTGTSVGARASRGAATGTTTWSGTSTGRRASRGTAVGTTTWSGTSTGVAPAAPGIPTGTAVGVTTWTGSSAGRRLSRGTATGTTTWSGAATGQTSVVRRQLTVGPRKPSRFLLSDPLPQRFTWRH